MKHTVNHIGDEGATSISESLKVNSTLTSIDLKSTVKVNKTNHCCCSFKFTLSLFEGNSMGKEGLKALTQSLKINTTLTELVLDSLQTT